MSKLKPIEYPYVLYAHYHRKPDQYRRLHTVKFSSIDDAAAWLMKMAHPDRVERIYGTQFICSTGIKISGDRLQEIAEANPLEGLVDDLHSAWIARFKYGTWDEIHERNDPVDGDTPAPPRPERRAKAQRPDGYVTITELCAASGVPAMIARAALRASNLTKPSYGWAFDPKEVPKIKKLCGLK
jgi:hypothetical protein